MNRLERYKALRYLLDEAEETERQIQKETTSNDLYSSGGRYQKAYGKLEFIKRRMQLIREIALKISREA